MDDVQEVAMHPLEHSQLGGGSIQFYSLNSTASLHTNNIFFFGQSQICKT